MSKELRENTGKAELPRNERGEGRTVEEKLLRQLRMSGHFLRYQAEGRGGQRRVLAALSHREAISQRELMEQLERLAREQGIAASRTAGPEDGDHCLIVILDKTE